jgi:hypothetical protein
MSSAVKILPYYTYEDYVQWEGKWELIDGIPYAMSPAHTPKASNYCQYLRRFILSRFKRM